MKLLSILSVLIAVFGESSFAFAPTSRTSTRITSIQSKADESDDIQNKESSISSRRPFLKNAANIMIASAAAGVSTSSPFQAFAAEEDSPFTMYQDSTCGFEVKVPSNWEKTEQMLNDRRKIMLFIDPTTNNANTDKTLMFVAFTPVRDDFTSLGSFGSVDQVAQMTILPKSQLAGEETENNMISSQSKNNAYYFDYTSKSPGQPMRHFRTIFALVSGATGGAGSVLVTLTAQTPESRYGEVKGMFDTMIDSYNGKLKK